MSTLAQSLVPSALVWLRRSYAIGFLAIVSVAAFSCGFGAIRVRRGLFLEPEQGPDRRNGIMGRIGRRRRPSRYAGHRQCSHGDEWHRGDRYGRLAPAPINGNLYFDDRRGGTINQSDHDLGGHRAPQCRMSGRFRMGTIAAAVPVSVTSTTSPAPEYQTARTASDASCISAKRRQHRAAQFVHQVSSTTQARRRLAVGIEPAQHRRWEQSGGRTRSLRPKLGNVDCQR